MATMAHVSVERGARCGRRLHGSTRRSGMNRGCVRVMAVSGELTRALVGAAGVGASTAALVLTDPSKRRQEGIDAAGGDEKRAVKSYFEQDGFNRWSKIYSDSAEVSKVQVDIREGHRQTVNKAVAAISGGSNLSNKTVLDAGCGTGSLAIPLAQRNASNIVATDISEAMVAETQKAAAGQGVNEVVKARVGDVEEDFTQSDNDGQLFDIVCCLDVMIHYPSQRVDAMVEALTRQCANTLVVSFAPETLAYWVLKRVGELAPGPSKATRAYLHREEDVERAINRHGFRIVSRDMTATDFYFSRMLICERATDGSS